MACAQWIQYNHRPKSAALDRMSRNTAQRPLASLLAHSAKAIDLLPHLHQHALDATGGLCSLLFQHNPRNGALQATSGFGLEARRVPTDRTAAPRGRNRTSLEAHRCADCVETAASRGGL